jgi:hypothetical protein
MAAVAPQGFAGAAEPLDQLGLTAVTELLGVGASEVWAVLTVETRGFGFLPDRRPAILFERHIFSRETEGRFDALAPDISSPQPGGYGGLGAPQYDRLARGITLDRVAALRSASWGTGQVMGFNAADAGFIDVEDMVAQMVASEDAQLAGMARWVLAARLHLALRAHDWAGFARGYNGPAYAQNRYDVRLAGAHAKLAAGPLPDLAVRAVQAYLTYLGYDPGPVDGLMGRLTRSALGEFQTARGLPVSDNVDAALLATLRASPSSPVPG